MGRLGTSKSIVGLGTSKVGKRPSWTPQIPTGLALTVISGTQIDGSFTINSSDHEGHNVYISTDAINYTLNQVLIGADNTFQATGLTEGVHYYFYIKAYKGAAEGGASSVADDVTWSTFIMQSVQPGTLSQVTLTYSMYVLGDVWVDWGNGTIEALAAGQNLTKVSNYASINTTYDIRVFGALYHLKQFKISNTTCIANFAGCRKFNGMGRRDS